MNTLTETEERGLADQLCEAMVKDPAPWCSCEGAGTCFGCLIVALAHRELGNSGVEYLRAHFAQARTCAGCSTLDALESMARQHCLSVKAERDYNGQVAGTTVTDSGALSADAEALETLAAHGRFRVVHSSGRMAVGYWPENDPEKKGIGVIGAKPAKPHEVEL